MAILCWFLSVACIIGSLETVSGESYPDGPEGWENLV